MSTGDTAAPAATPRMTAAGMIQRLLRFREFTLIVMIILVGLLLHSQTGRFFSTANVNAILMGFSASAIMMVGMTAALVSGGFDLSVGSVFAMGGVTAAVALRSGVPIGLAVALGIAAGALAGLINGLLITKAGINPFITTLGMMSIARGVGLAITEGSPIAGLPTEFFVFGQGKTLGISNLIQIGRAHV